MRFSFMRLTILVSLCFGMPHHCVFVQMVEAAAVEPLKVLIVAGGCCHDYATQTKLLKEGIEERINASVEVIYNPDTSTEARFDIYESDGWARDFDVVIHDDCINSIHPTLCHLDEDQKKIILQKSQWENCSHYWSYVR